MRKAGWLLLLGLVGCANGNRRLDSLPYVPDRIDGSYQGTLYLTSYPGMIPHHWWQRPRVDSALCPHTTYGVVEIGDHALYYDYAPSLTFNVPIQADGTLHQTIGTSSINGKVAHDRLTFDVATPVCTSRFFGRYKLNHS